MKVRDDIKEESFQGELTYRRLPLDLKMRILVGNFVRSKWRVKTREKGMNKKNLLKHKWSVRLIYLCDSIYNV